jgi:hypothetical protein
MWEEPRGGEGVLGTFRSTQPTKSAPRQRIATGSPNAVTGRVSGNRELDSNARTYSIPAQGRDQRRGTILSQKTSIIPLLCSGIPETPYSITGSSAEFVGEAKVKRDLHRAFSQAWQGK